MANSQQNSVTAQLEYQKLMFLASLGSVAQQMRHCASIADQFAQTLSQASFSGSSLPSLIPPEALGNGNKRQGTGDDNIEGPAKKRRVSNKRIKDPDAPKRAASSYLFFQNDLRQELRKEHPDISAAEVMARVSKQWAEMTREQKAPYERLQAEAKQKWEAEKRAYDERRGIEASAKPAVQKAAAAAPVEEPVHRNSSPGTKIARKPSVSTASSTDASLSDKSDEEEDGVGGNSDEDDAGGDDDDKEPSPPPPPPTKSKARSKASVAKPKSKVSSSTVSMPAKKKRSKAST